VPGEPPMLLLWRKRVRRQARMHRFSQSQRRRGRWRGKRRRDS
jgi:hypothetical protein